MKAKTKNTSLYSLILKLSISFLLLIGVTTAWFVFIQNAKVTPLELSVSKTTSVFVKGTDGSWTQELEIDKDGSGIVAISEFSGNGKKLFGPVAVNKQVVSFYPAPDSAANAGYIDFTLEFKSDGPVDIYIGDDSQLVAESFTSNLNGNGVSKNYIVGSVRVGMWCVEDDSRPVIWAPNSRFHYNTASKTISTSGTVEPSYQYATDETVANMVTVETNGAANGAADDGYFVWGDLAQVSRENMQPIITLQPEEGEEEMKTMRVRLWVEGTDREAVKDFIGGRFKIKLNFTAVAKEGEVTE